MNNNLITIAIAGALASPLFVPLFAVAADAPTSPHSFTGNVTLASEYLYRGIAQTNRKPALQGGFDYAHGSGFYAGVWGSNVSWLADFGGVSSSVELDVYGGYKGAITDTLSYDVGVLTYNYPGSYPTGFVDADTTEVYLGLGWQWLSAKYSYTTSSHLFGWVGGNGEKTRGSDYLELNAAYDLGDGWGLNGHVGHQKIKHLGAASYTDWKIGVTKDLGFAALGVAYVDTNANGGAGEPYRNAFGKDLGKGRLLVTFGKTF